jgi:hypothetical protein
MLSGQDFVIACSHSAQLNFLWAVLAAMPHAPHA